MSEAQERVGGDVGSDASGSESVGVGEPPKEREKAPPIESRFMFVDIAALRAKQLRRGAVPRVASDNPDPEQDATSSNLKLERIAIAEVQKGLIQYYPSGESSAADEGGESGASDTETPAATAATDEAAQS